MFDRYADHTAHLEAPPARECEFLPTAHISPGAGHLFHRPERLEEPLVVPKRGRPVAVALSVGRCRKRGRALGIGHCSGR